MIVLYTLAVCFLILSIIAHWYGDRLYFVLAILALIGHVIVALNVLPIVPYGWDISDFHNAAIELVEGGVPSASTTVTTFGTFQGLLYTVFGTDTRAISIFNSLLAVLIPIPVVYLTQNLYRNQINYIHGLMLLILFLPLPFFFLTIPMRDALSVLMIFCILALIVYILNNQNYVMILPLLPVLGAMHLLRPEWGLVLSMGFLAGLTFHLYDYLEVNVNFSTIVASGGVFATIGFLLFSEFLYSFEQVNNSLSFRASGGAVYLEGMQYTSWFDLLISAPGRAIYFQFAPFPLHIESIFHALAFISTIYIIIFVVSAARSIYACDTNKVVLVTLLIVYFAGITGYGVINSNFGTNVRHRIPFVFLLIVFAAPVIQRWELWIRQWLSVRPYENKKNHSKENKTKESDSHMQTRRKNPKKANE